MVAKHLEHERPPAVPKLRLGWISFIGFLTIAGFIGAFVGWAVLAPLSSAAIAPGVVVVESNKKTVQHLEGGIVAAILVKDGDQVVAGAPLVRLDVTAAKSKQSLLRARLDDAEAAWARLAAERDGLERLDFPAALLARATENKMAKILQAQRNIFAARRNAMAGQIGIIRQRTAQSMEEIACLKAQIRAQRTQLKLLAEEARDVGLLVKKGLAKKARLLQLRRRQAEIKGNQGRNRAAIARVHQRIGENKLTITVIGTRRINDAVEELKTVQATIHDLSEQIRASEDILRRTEIIAPISGIIQDRQIHTAGGVIRPGERLMDIVPSDDRLIVHARIDPKNIDVVQVGRQAQVRLTAHNQRYISPIIGTVQQISADRLDDARTGIAYYLAKVRLPPIAKGAPKGPKITAGMQAEVVINTGQRTVFEYFLEPVRRSFERAFRED